MTLRTTSANNGPGEAGPTSEVSPVSEDDVKSYANEEEEMTPGDDQNKYVLPYGRPDHDPSAPPPLLSLQWWLRFIFIFLIVCIAAAGLAFGMFNLILLLTR